MQNNNCFNQNEPNLIKPLLLKRQSKESSSAILTPRLKYSVVDSVKAFFLWENLVIHLLQHEIGFKPSMFHKMDLLFHLNYNSAYLDSWPAFCHHTTNVLFDKILPTVC